MFEPVKVSVARNKLNEVYQQNRNLGYLLKEHDWWFSEFTQKEIDSIMYKPNVLEIMRRSVTDVGKENIIKKIATYSSEWQEYFAPIVAELPTHPYDFGASSESRITTSMLKNAELNEIHPQYLIYLLYSNAVRNEYSVLKLKYVNDFFFKYRWLYLRNFVESPLSKNELR